MLRNNVQTNMLRSLFPFTNLNQCGALKTTSNQVACQTLDQWHWRFEIHRITIAKIVTRSSSSRPRVEGL